MAEQQREVLPADVPSYADFLARDTALRCAQLGELCAAFGQEKSYTCDDELPDDAYDAADVGAYSPEGGAACLNERAARGLAGRLARTGHGEPSTGVASACDGLFRGPAYGTIALEGRCTFHSDCAPLVGGRVQCVGFASDSRVCGGTLAAKAGDPCNRKDGTGLPLAPSEGLLCDHALLRYVATPALGEPCVDGVCGPAATCRAGVCLERFASGLACDTDEVCASGRCAGGRCADAGKRGDACASWRDCASGQCQAGRCERSYEYRYVCE